MKSLNHILQIIEFNESLPDGELDIIKHFPHFTDEELIIKKNKQNTFVVLSLNCQSLNIKMDQINMKLENLRKIAVKLEPWLSNDSNISLLQLDDFTLIFQGKICSAHGSLFIYLNNKYDYNILFIMYVWKDSLLR